MKVWRAETITPPSRALNNFQKLGTNACHNKILMEAKLALKELCINLLDSRYKCEADVTFAPYVTFAPFCIILDRSM